MSNIQLANNLKYLRKKHHLKQDDLRVMLNISRQAYSNYERGNRMPDLDMLLYLANFYNVTLNDLVLCNLSSDDDSFDSLSEGKIPYIVTKSPKNNHTLYLSEDEFELITKFRSLSSEKQALIKGFLLHNEK